MYSEFRATNEIDNTIQPGHAIIRIFRRETRIKPQKNDAKSYRLQDRRKFLIERAVNEDRTVKCWRMQLQPFGG